MPSRKDPRSGFWFYRKWIRLPNGERKRIGSHTDDRGNPFKTKKEADEAERKAIAAEQNPAKTGVPTFEDWFSGRFWNESVLGGPRGANKASEQQSKRRIFRYYLKDFFGGIPLDKIDVGMINVFRARLRAKKLQEKTINNVLSVLSKPLNYAAAVRVIDRAPLVGVNKVERPEAPFYEFEQWAALVAAAATLDERIATLLGGDHGLRVGEVRALRMSDVDMKARTLTVNQAVYEVDDELTGERVDVFDKPKGRTRRTIPMCAALYSLLRNRLRVGYVVTGTKEGPDGKYLSLGESRWLMTSLCRRAGLGELNRYGAWHILRHTFATHGAMLGGNPWTLNQWMGHKAMEETMMYVSLAQAHARSIPEAVLKAGEGIVEPDRKLRAQLDARSNESVISWAAVGPQKGRTGSKS
jgi:integrase